MNFQYVIITTEADGTERRDFWQPQWGKPTAKKMRDLVAKRAVPALRARVIEANQHLSDPAVIVDVQGGKG